MMQVLLSAALAASLLLLGCTAEVETRRTSEAPLPALVPQRVTATIQREAPRLVRLETEHEAFLTTPEHPFATPGSGWVRAGRLVPGDWVVSATFGAVRLLSARSEPAARPVPVFNLSVASSRAYFVGTERVLVHNTKCQPNEGESTEDSIARLVAMRKEINLQIQALTQTAPKSPRIAELKAERNNLHQKIYQSRKAQREKGVTDSSKDEATRRHFEADNETARKALEDAQRELAELESRPPASDDEKVTHEARKAALKKQIAALTLRHERLDRILTWLRKLAELEKATPETDAERRELEEKKNELRALLAPERKRARDVKYVRRKRADPQGREERAKQSRDKEARRLRTPAYLADTTRPRDPLELLEDELTGLLREAPSESRDARIYHLTEFIKTKKRLVEVRRESVRLGRNVSRARRVRERLVAEGKDTREVDERIERGNLELRPVRVELAQLRVKERLLARLDETPWAHAPGSVDEAQLREFERQLAGGLVNDQQLAEIERALDAMEPTDADREQTVLDEAHDVDETLREAEELLHQSPSPERAAALESSIENLQRELLDERRAYDAALFALVNEHAQIENTRASSSGGPTWEQRLRDNEAEMRELRERRVADLEDRLQRARQQLELMRRMPRFHDEASEAELARQVALLERELQIAGGQP